MDHPVLSIRDRIRQIQKALLDTAITPGLARESLVTLTALQGYVADELRVAEQEFDLVHLDCLTKYEKANRAGIEARTSPQHARFREAKDTYRAVDQTIKTCRAYLRSLDTELSNTR